MTVAAGSEVVEGRVRDDPRALSPHVDPGEGTLALATMPDDEFAARLEALTKGRKRILQVMEALMQPGTDYGTIPGTDRPTLLKPGAEILAQTYSLRPEIRIDRREVGDGVSAPSLSYSIICALHVGSLDGPVVGEGVGSANSWEKRYRWRRGGRVCPGCEKAGLVRTHKGTDKEQWWHPSDARPDGGCGANFTKDDPEVIEQPTEDVENPDPHDLDNTLLKIGKKRAFVDAVLTATAASGIFTQDLEDLERGEDGEEGDRPRRTGTHRQPTRGRQGSGQRQGTHQEPRPATVTRGEARWLATVRTQSDDWQIAEIPGSHGVVQLFHAQIDGEQVIHRILWRAAKVEEFSQFEDGQRVSIKGLWYDRSTGGREVHASAVAKIEQPLGDIALPDEDPGPEGS